jgi:hypothetical protein
MHDCFLSTAIGVNDGNLNVWNLDINHPLEYLHQNFQQPYPILNVNIHRVKKLKKIITSPKRSNSCGCNKFLQKF